MKLSDNSALYKQAPNSRLIFLTSTVAPSSIAFSGSIEQRRQEYIRAIQFYLSETKYKILVVDNSDYDFYNDFPNEERLEALHFIETRSVSKGKGYAESLLMQYGYEHSAFIHEATQIIKITGRHIIKNINHQLLFCQDENAIYANCNINLSNAAAEFFIVSKHFLVYEIFPRIEELNDLGGFYLEKLLGNAIMKWRKNGGKYHELVLPIYIVGRSGASGQKYHAPSLSRYCTIFAKYVICEVMNIFR